MAVLEKHPAEVKKPAIVVIDENKCKGCDLCVYYCPQETLALSKTIGARGYPVAIVVQDNCTGCQECARVCPDICIDIYRAV
jgi:2-oxoglutarate ferredoxin oxidoreductase subunit delta